MIQKAIEKLNDENKSFKGDQYASVMRSDVLKALINFCEQDAEFAQAVVQNDKTFSDCMKEVGKGCDPEFPILKRIKKQLGFTFPVRISDSLWK